MEELFETVREDMCCVCLFILSPLSLSLQTPLLCVLSLPLCVWYVVWLAMYRLSLCVCVLQFQDELTAQEQDGEGHEEEEEREEEAPALGTPTFNTPPDIP